MSIAVGWNCTNSRSPTTAPARKACAIAAPRASRGLVVTRNRPPVPPVASTVSRARTVPLPRGPRTSAPAITPSCSSSATARTPSSRVMCSARRTALAKARMIDRPARSPATRTTRGFECAASCDRERLPSVSRSKGTPSASRSSIRAAASWASNAAISGSTKPAPAAIVSAACRATLSPRPSGAATPPCAQALATACPSGAGDSTMQGRGAKRSASDNPASPAPMMRTSDSSASVTPRTSRSHRRDHARSRSRRAAPHAAAIACARSPPGLLLRHPRVSRPRGVAGAARRRYSRA